MNESGKATDLLRSECWQLTRCDDGCIMVHTDGDIVCHSDPNHAPGDLADEVRFALIAAAPDMFSVCRELDDAVKAGYDNSSDLLMHLLRAAEMARSALTKAGSPT